MSKFDLKKHNLSELAEAGFEFEVEFPGSFEPTGFFVKVRGNDSPKVKQFTIKKIKEAEAQKRANRNKEEKIDFEELEDLAVESCLVRLIGWKGLFEDEKPVEFSLENARRVLTEHDWIRTQILDKSNDVSNFTAK